MLYKDDFHNFIVSAIVAHDLRKGIGHKDTIPWHLKKDMVWFKKQTLYNICIMGRTTYDSIYNKLGSSLPDRHNIIISRTQHEKPIIKNGFITTYVKSIEDSLAVSASIFASSQSMKVFCIGGSSIYEQMMPYISQIYATVVKSNYICDKVFPNIDRKLWSFRNLYEDGDMYRFIYQRHSDIPYRSTLDCILNNTNIGYKTYNVV